MNWQDLLIESIRRIGWQKAVKSAVIVIAGNALTVAASYVVPTIAEQGGVYIAISGVLQVGIAMAMKALEKWKEVSNEQ